MQQLTPSQASPEVPINENFETLEWSAVYGKRHAVTTGLVWGYYGGRWGGTSVADGTVTLTNSAANYIVAAKSNGAVSVSTSTTNWLNTGDYARIYKVTVAGGVVTAVEDHRGGSLGVHGGGGGSSEQSITVTELDASDNSISVTPADAGVYLRFLGTGAKTATFSVGSAFATGDIFHLANRATSGNLTLVGSSVTLNAPKLGTLVLEPGDTVSVLFVDTDEADVYGSTVLA